MMMAALDVERPERHDLYRFPPHAEAALLRPVQR
jgi:hypothetical protein